MNFAGYPDVAIGINKYHGRAGLYKSIPANAVMYYYVCEKAGGR